MTLEEFAKIHQLSARWLSLRRECEALVRNPQYWCCPDMQNAARILATEASDILYARLKGRTRDSSISSNAHRGRCGEFNPK